MSGIDRRRVLRLFGAVGAAGAVTACGGDGDGGGPDEQRDTPVRIGLLLPTIGGYRLLGDDIRNGFLRFLTDTGGLLGGHPVVQVEEDEGDSPDAAVAGLSRLLEQDVHAVVGVVGSAALLAVSPEVEDAHVPLIAAHASPQQLTGAPYVWRTSYANHEPGLAVGRHLTDSVSGPVAVITPDDLAGDDFVTGLTEAFAEARASDQLLEPVRTPADDQPSAGFFTEPLTRVLQLAPSTVVAAYAGTAAVELVSQYLANGLDPEQLYGPATLTEGPVLPAVGAAAAGIRTAAHYAPELRGGANRAFAVGYRAEYGTPTSYAVAGYDAAAVLDSAIRATGGDPASRQINLALGEIGLVDSPRGRWQFNQNRTPTQKWYLREVRPDGRTMANLVVQELGTLG